MTIDPDIFERVTAGVTQSSLIKVIGEEAVAELSMSLAGTRIYIAQKPTEKSPIAVCIGLEAAQKLAKVWGGQEFEIPVRIGRKARILMLSKMGKNNMQIASLLKISLRNVRRIVNDAEEDPQLDLFLSPSDK